jgi:hypothetical protein
MAGRAGGLGRLSNNKEAEELSKQLLEQVKIIRRGAGKVTHVFIVEKKKKGGRPRKVIDP